VDAILVFIFKWLASEAEAMQPDRTCHAAIACNFVHFAIAF
jgi:hypothetical protein